jgi:alkylated DNA repair dioxygenase AlkB
LAFTDFCSYGDAGIGKHSHEPRDIRRNSPIIGPPLAPPASSSSTAARWSGIAEFALEHGSIVGILGSTQRRFHHTVPRRKRVLVPRINVTFRVLSGVR